jgi:hypothetical protein
MDIIMNTGETKAILLFGHRKRSGKDEICALMDDYYGPRGYKTRFAKLLKKQVAERYNLDYSKMDDGSYKNWKPPHLSPYPVWVKILGIPVFKRYKQLTVRDLLIEEGTTWARKIWNDCWSSATYKEIIDSKCEIGYIADYRFPNEYASYRKLINTSGISSPPKILRILVHRPLGIFECDGADDQLPDNDGESWDHVIYNDIEGGAWKEHLRTQLFNILEKEGLL